MPWEEGCPGAQGGVSEIREGRARPSYGSKKRWGWGFDGQNFKQETSATKWIINTNVKFS